MPPDAVSVAVEVSVREVGEMLAVSGADEVELVVVEVEVVEVVDFVVVEVVVDEVLVVLVEELEDVVEVCFANITCTLVKDPDTVTVPLAGVGTYWHPLPQETEAIV